MNKKLQLDSKNREKDKDIAIVYSSLPNKVYGKKKKLETIPLLSNMKVDSVNNLRIVKNGKKSGYNFIFERSKSANVLPIGPAQSYDKIKENSKLKAS